MISGPPGSLPVFFTCLANAYISFVSYVRENDSTCHIYAISNLRYIERTELRSSMKGICFRGRHFSHSVPVREARCLKAWWAQTESFLRAEISGSVVKVQRSGHPSRGAVTRFTFFQEIRMRTFRLFVQMLCMWKRKLFQFSIYMPYCLLYSV